ncbi:leucyl/phenylalanyl-tRNA--protein transferase [Panacibacter ginsenosidivorans]|uniref:Leucyl/phenylalanyl-tRNA--protein transferase n=1 Tax=Panacibacter ginsenosidivorans TaxID=1813871 RepID=A0A5B8VDR3_9BACT|nr:leucyl/phenylalanyl-tRNA--protein transferase [Panacibacter ginsenosidivorans]QEC69580.1 leucyl/phenylalanyl-tRNA--protein transferase [Panacibacter ginsenosidivorans]
MSLHALDNRLWFPPVDAAQEDGLLAIGGDLSVQRLLMAYERGIFPWYEGDVPVWWCPDPRFVLNPDELKVSKSMKQLFKRNAFTFTINKAFREVINNCKKINRPGQDGTWITNEVLASYKKMHEFGYAHSAEVWLNNELVGGLYGIRLGKVFFGESMFSLVSNASKYALISYVKQLKKEGVQLIDCQVYTEHLESLGAKMISRNNFIDLLHKYIGEPG